MRRGRGRSRGAELIVAACALGAATLQARSTHAQNGPERVLLITADPELQHATRTSLSAWNLKVTIANFEPEAEPGQATTSAIRVDLARALARQHQAEAVVWTGAGKLVVYDAAHDRTLGTRAVPQPPFDATTAAALVLSVKTLLERAGPNPSDTGPIQGQETTEQAAAVGGSQLSTSQSRELPLPESPPSRKATLSPTASTLRDQTSPPAIASKPFTPSNVDIVVSGGARAGLGPAALEPRIGVAANWWLDAGALGIGFHIDAGPGIPVDRSGITARLVEPGLGVAALLRMGLAKAWTAAASVGPTLHLVLLRGSLEAAPGEVAVIRIAPQAQLSLQLQWRAAEPVTIGISALAELSLLRQRFWIADQLAHETRRLALGAYLTVGFPFHF